MAMKWFCALLLVVVTLSLPTGAQNSGFNVDRLLANEPFVDGAIQCLLEKGDRSCTPPTRLLKGLLPQLLQTNCATCNENQRRAVTKVLQFLTTKRRPQWEQLVAKYDPDGRLRRMYGNEWRRRGVNL